MCKEKLPFGKETRKDDHEDQILNYLWSDWSLFTVMDIDLSGRLILMLEGY